jgi:hypothetical protein
MALSRSVTFSRWTSWRYREAAAAKKALRDMCSLFVVREIDLKRESGREMAVFMVISITPVIPFSQ